MAGKQVLAPGRECSWVPGSVHVLCMGFFTGCLDFFLAYDWALRASIPKKQKAALPLIIWSPKKTQSSLKDTMWEPVEWGRAVHHFMNFLPTTEDWQIVLGNEVAATPLILTSKPGWIGRIWVAQNRCGDSELLCRNGGGWGASVAGSHLASADSKHFH